MAVYPTLQTALSHKKNVLGCLRGSLVLRSGHGHLRHRPFSPKDFPCRPSRGHVVRFFPARRVSRCLASLSGGAGGVGGKVADGGDKSLEEASSSSAAAAAAAAPLEVEVETTNAAEAEAEAKASEEHFVAAEKASLFLMRCDGVSCSRETVKENDKAVSFAHATTQQIYLMWKDRPRNVLVLKRFGLELVPPTLEMVQHLSEELGLTVWLEPQVHARVSAMAGYSHVHLCESADERDLIDFVVTIGGDGLILHASKMYPGGCPPILCFAGGSLGFLTTHKLDEASEATRALVEAVDTNGYNIEASARGGASRAAITAPKNPDVPQGAIPITLRMRLMCTVVRSPDNGIAATEEYQVLNEVVIDRGPAASLTMLECYIDGVLVTKVQADGVLISTPTGSTAYNASAGGSMVHPNVPCILFTPICPHSLSFRPVVLPDSAEIELRVPSYSRNNACVSFDGSNEQVALERGDMIRIQMSEHPMLTVNRSEATSDWFASLARCLNWNERMEQKPSPLHQQMDGEVW
ncbi:NAD kinase [Pseudoscourfieldia marina]